jgi:hypothetical protein
MLGFRSEAEVDEWCEHRKLPRRPLLTLMQQWRLAVEWYGNRLTVESRRPGPDEMRRIFSEIGLTDPFWDPQSDRFG